jgi:hypothetical protein
MILLLGYVEQKRGKTGGTRRKFYNAETQHLIMLDEPHDGDMGPGMVARLREDLVERGVL